MRVYTAIVYIRRLEKAGFFGESEKKEDYGTTQEFIKLFGNKDANTQ